MKDFFTLFKQIARESSTKFKILAGAGAALGLLSVTMIALAGWSPERSVYNYNNESERVGSMNGPRMNAFINTPFYGDERTFFDACSGTAESCKADNGGVFKDILPNAADGDEVVLRTYIHNGANQSTNESGVGVAKNAKLRISLPTGTAKALRATSFINISNPAAGYPGEVTDTAEMFDENTPFSISYVPGSAKIFTDKLNGAALSDNIVTDGALIGYDAVNGNIPGCFEFKAIVVIRVKVSGLKTELAKEVRKAGQTTWTEHVSVAPGDKTDWLVSFQNTGEAKVNDVSIGDKLPKHLRVVPGSVIWRYVDTQGKVQDAVQSDTDFFNGVTNFHDWNPGGGFSVRFTTVALDDFTGCEVSLTNIAFMRTRQNPGDREDNAKLTITKPNCVPSQPPVQPPAPAKPAAKVTTLPDTGPGEVAGIFAAVSAIGTVAYRLRLVRKFS